MSMLARFAASGGKAALQYVGGYVSGYAPSTSDITVSLTSLTGGIASAPAADDFVIVTAGSSTPNTDLAITASGYTQVAKLYVTSSDDTILYAGYKRMGSTPDTTITFTGGTTSTNASLAVAVHVWRNVDSIIPLDVPTTTATGTNTIKANPPAITPVNAGTVVIAGGVGGWDPGTAAGPVFTSSDLSNFITVGGPKPSGASTMGVVGMGSYAWTSGAFDAAQFGFTGTDNTSRYSWCSFAMAIAPKLDSTPPSYVDSVSTQNTSTGTTLSIARPTNTLDGDLMIAFCNASNGTSSGWTGPAGWTEVADLTNSGRPVQAVYYKTAAAGETVPFVFTCATANRTLAGTIISLRGATYDTIGSAASGASPLVLPSVTGSGPGYEMLVAIAGRDATGITITPPSSMTTRVTDSDSTTAPSYVIATEISRSGATGTRSFTVGSATNVNGLMLLAKAS